MKSRRPHTAAFISLCFAQAATPLFGQTTIITKADNATDLNLAGSYVENTLPSSTTKLVIDDTLTVGRGVGMSEDTSFWGIETSTASGSTSGGLFIFSGNLKIYGGGINTNSNAPGLYLYNPVALGANQNWSLNGNFGLHSTSFSDNGHTLNITGGYLNMSPAGNLTLGANVTIGVSTVYINQPNAVVTLGGQNTFDDIAVFDGRVVVATIGNYGVASNFGDGGTNSAVGLGLSPTTNGTFEYTGTSASTNRIFTRNAESPTSGIVVSNPDATLTLTANLGSGTAVNSGTNGWVFGGAGNLSLSVIISDSTGIGSTGTTITKNGSGTLTVSGSNTYTGVTNVTSGVLAVNGSLGNTSITIGTGASLQGSGSIAGSVTMNGGATLATGNSIESLATGALSLLANSTFAYEANNNVVAGVAGDLTAVTGNLTLDLNSLAVLTLTELGSGSWSVGEKLTLISYSGAWNGGLFKYTGNTLADDSTFAFSDAQWRFNYNDTLAGTNYTSDLTGSSFVTMTVVIPEPSAALLGGLVMLALLRRRRCA